MFCVRNDGGLRTGVTGQHEMLTPIRVCLRPVLDFVLLIRLGFMISSIIKLFFNYGFILPITPFACSIYWSHSRWQQRILTNSMHLIPHIVYLGVCVFHSVWFCIFGILGNLFFADDGWGRGEFRIEDGSVTIRAWTFHVVISEQHVSRVVNTDNATDENDHIIAFDQFYDIDKNIIVVQVNF